MMAHAPRLACLLVALAAAGCASPGPVVVHEPPLLALHRDRYVLPPDPPAPEPCWSDQRLRELEAEWPPVDALSLPPPPPPDGPLPVRPAPRLSRPRPPLEPPPPRPQVHGLPHVDSVILRAVPPAQGAPARVVLILEAR